MSQQGDAARPAEHVRIPFEQQDRLPERRGEAADLLDQCVVRRERRRGIPHVGLEHQDHARGIMLGGECECLLEPGAVGLRPISLLLGLRRVVQGVSGKR